MVQQLINERGNYAANQFVINTNKATYFQSYRSVVAKVNNKGKLTLSQNWDYSRTTMKHLYIFLRRLGFSHLCGAKEMRKAIKEKEVTLLGVGSMPIK